MKTTGKILILSILSGCLFGATAIGQTMIQNFEYASDADLMAAWTPTSSTISLSPNVAAGATGVKSMKVERSFAAAPWENEMLMGPVLASPMALTNTQYITLRIAGDPQFTNSSFRIVYVHLYDAAGNVARVGSLVPTTTNWCVLNMRLTGTNLPYGSPGLPDLSNITRFSIMVFGQGDPAGAEFSSTIYVDELQVRDTPLFPPSPAGGVTMIQDFEYASDADMLTQWSPYTGTISLSPYVASHSKGTNSLRLDRSFAGEWDTEVITGPQLPAALALAPTQYLTIRVAGDPRYTNATYNTLFIYAFDGNGYFSRVGSAVPTSTNWQVFNFLASDLLKEGAKPWDSLGYPELNNIVQFKFYIYGQGSPAGNPFDSVTYIDDLQIRDTALVEFDPPSPMRALLDNFESYANDDALRAFYSYVPSGATPTASLETPAPQGTKALKLAIDYTAIQYPWAAVLSSPVTPFSFPTNGVVQCKFKGDPTMATVADAGTSFWITFYDNGGRAMSCNDTSAEVSIGEWTTIKARYDQFWSGTPVDNGNIVQWRLLVQGWTGDPNAIPGPLSATFYIDDVQITVPPTVAIVRDGTALKLQLGSLISGTTYTIRQTTDFASWSTAGTVTATSGSATWTIPSGQKGYFQVSYTP